MPAPNFEKKKQLPVPICTCGKLFLCVQFCHGVCRLDRMRIKFTYKQLVKKKSHRQTFSCNCSSRLFTEARPEHVLSFTAVDSKRKRPTPPLQTKFSLISQGSQQPSAPALTRNPGSATVLSEHSLSLKRRLPNYVFYWKSILRSCKIKVTVGPLFQGHSIDRSRWDNFVTSHFENHGIYSIFCDLFYFARNVFHIKW